MTCKGLTVKKDGFILFRRYGATTKTFKDFSPEYIEKITNYYNNRFKNGYTVICQTEAMYNEYKKLFEDNGVKYEVTQCEYINA